MAVNQQLLNTLNITSAADFPSYAWPGGYPVFYYTDNYDVLCPECARKTDEFDEEITGMEANWEDPDLYCHHCSGRIESAYAEED